MQLKLITKSILVMALGVLIYLPTSSCKKQEYTLPSVVTGTVKDITQTTVYCDGRVTDEGSASVTARGIVWNSKGGPVITKDSLSTEGKGKGEFYTNISGLLPSTYYYIRAYATNSVGTMYGNLKTFWTLGPPVIATDYVLNVTSSSATISGSFVYDGGKEITEMGLCYSTDSMPDINDNVLRYSGTDSTFSFNIDGLTPFTTYYVRAFGTNGNGLAYGIQRIFNTLGGYVVDIDDNTYEVVKIGEDQWLSSNLKSTKYNDGTQIPYVADVTEWASTQTPAYCYYENNDSCKNIYGLLYNWYAVEHGNLCPVGFHVSSDSEWVAMDMYLVDDSGSKIKEVGNDHWDYGVVATNETNFTAIPGGYRDDNGIYKGIKKDAAWWTDNANGGSFAWSWSVSSRSSGLSKSSLTKNRGLSVRCIKD